MMGMPSILYSWRILIADWTDRVPGITGAGAHVEKGGIEIHQLRVVRGRIERRGPVVAVGTGIVEVGIVPEASGGKEYALVFVALDVTFHNSSCNACSIVIVCPVRPRQKYSLGVWRCRFCLSRIEHTVGPVSAKPYRFLVLHQCWCSHQKFDKG